MSDDNMNLSHEPCESIKLPAGWNENESITAGWNENESITFQSAPPSATAFQLVVIIYFGFCI